MEAFIIIAALVALPVVLGLTMRVSASHLFFSVMAGELLARYFGHDAYSVIESFSRNTTFAGYAEVIVMTIPVILTAVFLKGSMSRGKTMLHFIPFVITGIVYAVFAVVILPGDVQTIVRENAQTSRFLGVDSIVIGFIVFFQLVALWLLNRGGEEKRKKKHKK